MNNFPTDIKNYAKLYENVFTKEFCESTIESLKSAQWNTHQFYNSDKEYINVGSDFVNARVTSEQQAHIDATIHDLIYQYVITDHAAYYEEFKWFSGWVGATGVKFHRYDQGTNMRLHCDHIHDIFDGERQGVPVLSIVGLLNDDFEGGDFLLWEKEKVNFTQGSVLIFPSNFMYPHEVTTITKGSRYSFVSWAW
jgi:predicted 2-oxoglutarate/Fe(II)-dependent dioxygenase YbiX